MDWISVKDELPRSHKKVLVAYLPGFHMDPATKKVRPRRWQIMFSRYSGGQWRFLVKNEKTRKPERIRYWMPLESPRGDN